MNLKTRIALNLSMAFSIVMGIVMTVIYVSFANFRKAEFKENLEHSVIITSDYLKKLPDDLLNKEDKNVMNINNSEEDFLIREKVLVFNNNKNLVFTNAAVDKNVWNVKRLKSLDNKNKIFWTDNDHENIGIKTKIRDKYYYILTSAEDINGNAKLNFLTLVLISIFLISVGFIWAFSFYFMKKQLKPLDDFKDKITDVTSHQLTIQLPEQKSDNEINVLIKAFNTMLRRLNEAFLAQKEFTTSASHEIKTPLTRMSFQLENLFNLTSEQASKEYITSIQNEVYQLSDTVNSLLVLSKVEEDQGIHFENVRMDEVVFDAFANVKKNFKDFEMDFEIKEQSEDGDLTIKGIKSLLEIVFINLFKNVCLYSFEPKAKVEISETDSEISVKITNQGKVVAQDEKSKIFEAFQRGENSQNISGSGLGLRISKRIMDFHHGEIVYEAQGEAENIFTIHFMK